MSQASPAGLSSAEAALRRVRRGRRAPSAAVRFLCLFTGPPSLALVLAGLLDLLVWQRAGNGLVTLGAAALLAGWAAGAAAHAPGTPIATVTALRDEQERPVPVAELVPGDLLVLAPGDVLPADVSIVDSHRLVLDGGPVAGAVVLAGTGRGVLTRLPDLPLEPAEPPPETPRPLELVAVLAALLLAAVLTVRAPAEFARTLVLGLVLIGVLLSVRPGALAALAATAARRRMAAAGARVLDPRVVDRLARVSVLCLDEDVVGDTGAPKLSAAIPAPGLELPDLWLSVLRVTEAEGPAEDAVLHAAAVALEGSLPPLGLLVHRFAAGQWRASRHRLGGSTVVTVLGEPEAVLPRCADGDRFARAVAELTTGRHRVLALAHAQSTVDTEDELPPGLAVVGLLATTGTVRQAAAWRLAELRHLGIRVVLACGGSRSGAAELAARCGIGRRVVDLAAIGEDRAPALRTADVLAHCPPETLAEVVAAHQDAGEVVAVVSDRPAAARALRAAEVGVAATGQSAGLLAPGDRLRVLAAAVRHSRVAARNRHAATAHLAATGLGLLLTLLGAALLLPVPSVLPVHLAWLALAAGVLPATALAVDRTPGESPDRCRWWQPWPDALALSAAALLCALLGDPAGAPARLVLALLAGGLALPLAARRPLAHGWSATRRFPLLSAAALGCALALSAIPVLGTAFGLSWIGLHGLGLVLLAGLLVLGSAAFTRRFRPFRPAEEP